MPPPPYNGLTDVAGYRSDGGGLGQDQGVSGPLQSIVSAKLPLLNAPGSILENSLYYDIHSSSVTAVEQQASFAKDRISLNNLTLGTSPAAYIPSVLFANTLFWVASFDGQMTSPAIADTPKMPHGWGFALLETITTYMGASSIASITISGKTNFMIAMACCETNTKKTVCLDGAGRFLNSTAVNSPLGVPVAPNSNTFVLKNYGDLYSITRSGISPAPSLAQCVVPIRLPWTSMCVLHKRLSLDCKLLNQPIQITLQTGQRAAAVSFPAGISNGFAEQFNTRTFDNFPMASGRWVSLFPEM